MASSPNTPKTTTVKAPVAENSAPIHYQGRETVGNSSLISQRQRMMLGWVYDCHSEELIADRRCAKILCQKFNQCLAPYLPEDREKYLAVVKELLPNLIKPEKSFIEPSGFQCDYGYNIFGGEGLATNTNVHLGDDITLWIGKDVFIGPNVTIHTSNHPYSAADRCNANYDFSREVCIGDNVWLASGSIVISGVTIGSGAIIGAGSVVTKDIPPNCIAVGNPARPIYSIPVNYVEDVKLGLGLERAIVSPPESLIHSEYLEKYLQTWKDNDDIKLALQKEEELWKQRRQEWGKHKVEKLPKYEARL